MLWLSALGVEVAAADVALPTRLADAPGGRAIIERIRSLDLVAREEEILRQVAQGNVPAFWRWFVDVPLRGLVEGRERVVVISVAPDYVAIGRDDDYFLAPITPRTAQAIGERIGCVLPTRRTVDAIYAAAALKLVPTSIPPSLAMTTVPVFAQHHAMVWEQRAAHLASHPLGCLVAGHKKDVVLTARLAAAPGKVAIYGWHQTNSIPIQPLYLGHTDRWVDYSHGARLVRRVVAVDGVPSTLAAVLEDPKLSGLVSDEGPIALPRYFEVSPKLPSPTAGVIPESRPMTNQFGERLTTLTFDRGVRVVLLEPDARPPGRPVRLVLYALPNGNTIEQTIGKRLRPGDDWHFDIQHIGAQTRWLREHDAEVTWVVAFLECEGRSWPSWHRREGPEDRRIPLMVESLRNRYGEASPRLVLTGHSGGGSFTFGYLNGVESIPDEVERIAFLDSNYAYDSAKGHADKLAAWLKSSESHHLCVLAYHDSVALLDGKTFVSEKGGTWGRSHAMQSDLAAWFRFEEEHDAAFQRYRALSGRVVFLLKENPEKAVLHTRQVEWNGFIHAMLNGTAKESRDYTYFGARAYDAWVVGE